MASWSRPRDPAALAQVIGRVLDDPDAALRMGEAGRAAVTDLTWARNAARQIEIYEAAVGGGGYAAAPHRRLATPKTTGT